MKSRVGFKNIAKFLTKVVILYIMMFIFLIIQLVFSLYVSNVHDHPIPLLVWKNFPSLKVFNDLGKCGI